MKRSKQNFDDKSITIMKLMKAIVFVLLDKKTHKLVLFGSRARGDNTERSDYDFGIIGPEKLSTRTLGRIQALAEAMPAIIDVVDFARTKEPFTSEALKDAIIL